MVSNFNVNQKYNVPMQALNGQSSPNGIAMQGPASEQLKQSVNNSRVASRANASEESPYKLPLTVAAWYGLNKGADAFNRVCQGDMQTSILGRAGTFGDNLSDKIKSTAPGRGLSKAKGAVSRAFNWLAGKSKAVNAMKNLSTQPEWGFARMPFEGLNGFVTMDINSLFETYLKPINDPIALQQYGVSKADIDAISNSLKGLSTQQRTEKLLTEELKALGFKETTIQARLQKDGVQGLQNLAKRLKIRKLGFTEADFTKWQKATYDNTDILYKALEKSAKDPKFNISAWRWEKVGGSKRLGNFVSKLIGRQVTLTELRNKLAVATGKSGARTTLGRSLQKSLGWIQEGFTGRFGGGKFIPLMFAGILADSIISSFKAKKGEHVSTFADRTFNDFSYAFAMPLGLMGLHKIGAMKYAGMTKDQVEAFRAERLKFIEDIKNGVYKGDKAGFKAKRKALKGLLGKGFWSKIGRFVNIGNETLPSYHLNGFKKFGKNAVGVPLRIAIVMGLISPFISKWFTKGAHAIFGRPSKSVLDKEVDETEEIAQNPLQQQNTQQTAPVQPIVHSSETNLLNMKKNGQTYQNTTTNITNNTVVKNEEKTNDNKTLEPKRTYIPSPVGVQIAGDDPTAANAAIARTAAAEKMALEVLNMR